MDMRNARSGTASTQNGPDPIDFGVAPPHGSADATFTIPHAQSDALLTASIVADNSQGRFRILWLKSYADEREQGSGTGDIEKHSTDGNGPLKVSRGQRVEIALRFYSLLPKGQDYFKAVLVIQEVTAKQQWEPIHVGMIALVGGVTTILPPTIQIQRGRRLSVPITVISDAGPDTTVSYIMRARPGGISMTPLHVSLPRGKRVTATVELAAAPTALLGTQDVILDSDAFDGKLVMRQKLSVTLHVTRMPQLDLPQPQPADLCQYFESLSGPPSQGYQTLSNWGIIDLSETCLGFLPTLRLFQPTNPYEIANAIRHAEAAGTIIRALGSGWSFSDAVLPQSGPIEGVDAARLQEQGLSGQPDEAALRTASSGFISDFGYTIDMTRSEGSLQTLLPNILADSHGTESLFFVEGGMTIHRLNHLLDAQTPRVALKTMGGAVGQTIAGAIATGTHGGDFDRPPLADSVRAIYLVGKGTGVGAGGTHHWIEPKSRQITDPMKIRVTFPCIHDWNIHYDDDMFRAVLVSMGAMGVIYAVILDVVPQYSLLAFNRQSTWEGLKRDMAESNWGNLFNGTWTGISRYLEETLPIEQPPLPRFAQVVINPMRRDGDREHSCRVTNRVEFPLRPRSGLTPAAGYAAINNQVIFDAIEQDPNFDTRHRHLNFGIHLLPLLEGKSQLEQIRIVLDFCKRENYPWAVRAAIDAIIRQFLPIPGDPAIQSLTSSTPPEPQIDVGFEVMAPGGISREFPTLGIASVESAFSFLPRTDHPGSDVITFIDAALGLIDEGVERDRVFPGGYLALRVTGRTAALMGMQRFDRNGFVELALFGNRDDYELVRRVEQLALDLGGALHWGQSNGLLKARDVEVAYGAANVARWREVQQELGGPTFTNFFMNRCGFVPTPILRVDPISIRFDTTPVGDVSRVRTFRITNEGSGPLQVSLSALVSGSFRWGDFSAVIPPGGSSMPLEVEFSPVSGGSQTRTLLLESNAPGSPHPVALSGTGYQSPPDQPPVQPL